MNSWHLLLGAETPARASAFHTPHGLSPIDWGIICVYCIATILLGAYYSRKQESVKEYFLGSGQMHPLLIGVSLFATLLSTISYMSMPGEALGKGPAWMCTVLALPISYIIVGHGMLPVYMKYRVTSAYELLEARLGLSVRLLGATLFLSLRLVWMSLLVYVGAKAMSIMMGFNPDDESRVQMIAAGVAAVSVVYTSLGGLRAVVITDLIQSILLYGGALLVIGTVSWNLGGFGWIPTSWQPHWDEQKLMSFDPKERVTVFGSILTVLVWNICTAGGDQTTVQRFMSTKDAVAARRSYAIQLTVTAIVSITLAFVGFALMGYFTAHPEFLPDSRTMDQSADQLFPHYITYHLPVGISGLVVSGMLAAAMSSVDSGVNSITAVVMTDFLDRFGFSPKDERQHVWAARFLALSIGIIVTLLSTYIGLIPGNITAVTKKTAELFTTPIFSLFFFALFVPFARTAGVWAGTAAGILMATSIAYSGPLVVLLNSWLGIDPALFGVTIDMRVDQLTGRSYPVAEDPISFQWINPVALVTNIGVGCLVSLMLGPERKKSE